MIGKVGKGSDFGGLAAYLTRDDRGEVIDMRHLASDSPDEAAAEMQLAASMSRRCKSPVMHLTVSYDPSDGEPTNDQMRADAAEVLGGLNLEDAQAVVIRHRDAAHPHMHLMVNRVGSDGKAVSDSNSYAKVEASLRRIEHRRGLTVTEGRHAPSPTTRARMVGARTSTDPRQHTAPARVRETLLTAKSWPELHAGLARDGWKMETTQQAGKKAGAVLVGPEGQRIGAGKVDRGATLARLQARLDPPKPTANRAWSDDQARPRQPSARGAAGLAAGAASGIAPTLAGVGMMAGGKGLSMIGGGKTRLGTGLSMGRKKGKSRRSVTSLTSRMGL